MYCFIIDDEQHAIDTLTKYVQKIPELKIVGSSTDAITALSMLKKINSVDIVFLDVDMPGLSGIELAELIPFKTNIVFTTAHAGYALNAFELNAIDFLLKPISFPKFLKTVEKLSMTIAPAQADEQVSNESIFINPGIRGKVIQLRFSDILYVEGLKNYVILYTKGGGKNITYLKMNEIMEALPARYFSRIHKSFIINRNFIVAVEGNQVQLVEQIKVPLGISYKNSFMQLIAIMTVKTNR